MCRSSSISLYAGLTSQTQLIDELQALFVVSFKMSKEYSCKKCGQKHTPPTGRKCTRHRVENGEQGDDVMSLLMRMDAKMDTKFDAIERRVAQIEIEKNDSEQETQRQEQSDSSEEETDADQQDNENEITPETLRSDVRAMERAARRIAQFKDDDSDDSEGATGGRRRKSGKKSGYLMVAADKVKKVIDWPHMHINRLIAGRRVAVPFNDLKVEEFVYGFLEMLDAPKAKWNRPVMLGILKMMMQDAMDYSWSNALSFYQLLGVDVESGMKRWDDVEVVRDMRMMHSRSVFPAKQQATETKKNNGGKSAQQNL